MRKVKLTPIKKAKEKIKELQDLYKSSLKLIEENKELQSRAESEKRNLEFKLKHYLIRTKMFDVGSELQDYDGGNRFLQWQLDHPQAKIEKMEFVGVSSGYQGVEMTKLIILYRE